MTALPNHRYTVQEYLQREREAPEKSEFFQGEIFMMAGASFTHNCINENLSVEIGIFLKGKPCRSFSRDLKLHIPENTLFTYPDLMVICGKPEFLDSASDTVLNPTLIVEVLSKSTADYDRGSKFELYRQIPAFKEYVLVDSSRVKAEVWLKNEQHRWTLVQETAVLVDNLLLHNLDFSLPLALVYADTDLF